MEVTDILRDRMQTPAGLQKMVSLSIAVHVLLGAGLMVSRGGFGRHEVPPTLMTISLSGSAGPENGGMTALGGRPVQAVTARGRGEARGGARAGGENARDDRAAAQREDGEGDAVGAGQTGA